MPEASLSAADLTYSAQVVGTSSEAKIVMLSNTGASPLAIVDISVTEDFVQANDCGSSLAVSATCAISIGFKPAAFGTITGSLVITDNAPGSPHVIGLRGIGVPTSNISSVWANEGGDKVTQDELRASHQTENLTGKVLNGVWDGTKIKLSGAHNEVISFNLVLEAAQASASNVTVRFDTLTGPGGATIASSPARRDGVFNWVGRPIELFYVRYLQIKGLSYFGYGKGDERQVPVRFQRPWSGNGIGTGGWADRPDHDKFYPDVMVPLELVPSFDIAQGQNQSIWSDIYIPKNVPSGVYTGSVIVQEDGVNTHTIPVELNLQNFTLPDTPTAKTMVNLDTTDIEWRYVTGYGGYTNWNSPGGMTVQQVTDKYFELFHRHKLSLIGQNECPVADAPCASSLPRLNGSLFTAGNGYDGPGVNTPNDVFSIGTYGTWGSGTYGVAPWKYDLSLFRRHIDNWVTWFEGNLPKADYFIYLQDEPGFADFGQVETWSQWIANDPGPGRRLRSMATVDAVIAKDWIPTLALPVTHATIGTCRNGIAPCNPTETMQAAVDFYNTTPGRKFWAYNDGRPAVGTFDTEDDGISPRTIPWAQYKKGVDRWFYWYANVNNPSDWFSQATTWGSDSYFDPVIGWTGDDCKTNGNGLLVYPGTDVGHPSNSYGVHGPFASLRLKEWRRGVQDVDYLALANRIDAAATQAVMDQVMTKALWEYQTTDPTWYSGTISWSSDPDTWEAARGKLARIIGTYCAAHPSADTCASN